MSTIFDVRNPLHLLKLMNGRAQPIGAWRQRHYPKTEQVARLVRKAGVFRPLH